MVEPSKIISTPTRIAQVLLVDDEPKLRESLAEGLRLENWQVATAGDGAEAMRLIESHAFDLLVLDCMLPDFDGVEVLRRVRARGLRVPALIISARSTIAAKRTAFESGANAFVAKPFGLSDIVAKCHALLGSPPAQPNASTE